MEILPQLLVNALITGSIYALASAGLSLSYGFLHVLNLAHGHLMMIGAYVLYVLLVWQGYPLPAAAMVTLVAIAVMSALCFRVAILPFIRCNPILTLVSTLALGTAMESVIAMTCGVETKSLPTGDMGQSIELYGVYITPLQILIVASAVVLLGLLACAIHYTQIGRQVRAIAENEAAAASLGVPFVRTATATFVVSTLLAAYAGVLVGFETNLQPTMGNLYTIKALAAVTLGGVGNIWGAMAGSYLLGLVENLSIGLDLGPLSVPSGYKDAIAFIAILLMLLWKPSGLFLKRERSV